MNIPTEPIGSVPRPRELIEGMGAAAEGRISDDELNALFAQALEETIAALEATGSPVISDGEQLKPSFVTYPIHGLASLAANGVVIPFEDGHTRQLPTITEGPFRYQTYADSYLERTQHSATRPVKQAVISASALSLLYPADGIDGYSRDEFIADLIDEAEADIRRSLDRGADSVQIDFTEGRLSLKLDPSGGLLQQFLDLNNAVIGRFTPEEQKRIGVHSCPGGDHDSTHSADVDYAGLIPGLLSLDAGRFYLELAGESDPRAVLETIRANLKPGQLIFVGVTNPIDPAVETAEQVRDRVLLAAEYIPLDQLGTTDDCGFAPFADDTSTARDTAFAKIKARIDGTKLAEAQLG
ncbi:MAG TPA: cobalamin-independent methionine synthase II family protein [Gaiellaceae bacterium]